MLELKTSNKNCEYRYNKINIGEYDLKYKDIDEAKNDMNTDRAISFRDNVNVSKIVVSRNDGNIHFSETFNVTKENLVTNSTKEDTFTYKKYWQMIPSEIRTIEIIGDRITGSIGNTERESYAELVFNSDKNNINVINREGIRISGFYNYEKSNGVGTYVYSENLKKEENLCSDDYVIFDGTWLFKINNSGYFENVNTRISLYAYDEKNEVISGDINNTGAFAAFTPVDSYGNDDPNRLLVLYNSNSSKFGLNCYFYCEDNRFFVSGSTTSMKCTSGTSMYSIEGDLCINIPVYGDFNTNLAQYEGLTGDFIEDLKQKNVNDIIDYERYPFEPIWYNNINDSTASLSIDNIEKIDKINFNLYFRKKKRLSEEKTFEDKTIKTIKTIKVYNSFKLNSITGSEEISAAFKADIGEGANFQHVKIVDGINIGHIYRITFRKTSNGKHYKSKGDTKPEVLTEFECKCWHPAQSKGGEVEKRDFAFSTNILNFGNEQSVIFKFEEKDVNNITYAYTENNVIKSDTLPYDTNIIKQCKIIVYAGIAGKTDGNKAQFSYNIEEYLGGENYWNYAITNTQDDIVSYEQDAIYNIKIDEAVNNLKKSNNFKLLLYNQSKLEECEDVENYYYVVPTTNYKATGITWEITLNPSKYGNGSEIRTYIYNGPSGVKQTFDKCMWEYKNVTISKKEYIYNKIDYGTWETDENEKWNDTFDNKHGDLLGHLGFNDKDLLYQRNCVSKSFLRLSFYDSPYRNAQKLLFYSTIHLDSDKIYNNLINAITKYPSYYDHLEEYEYQATLDKALYEYENKRLSASLTCSDRTNDEYKSDGFYLHLFKNYVNGAKPTKIYMKAEFNNAKYGKIIPLVCKRSNTYTYYDNTSKQVNMDVLNKDLYTEVYIAYIESENRYVWIPTGDSVSYEDNTIIFNLCEPKLY